MKYLGILLAGAVLGVLAFTSLSVAQNSSSQAPEQGQAQGPGKSGAPPIAGQGGESDSTLEIAPQPGAIPNKPKVDVIPGGRNFQPGADTASINPNFNPNADTATQGELRRPTGKPYLGISVRYTTECFLGKEEDGLEIMQVDPNSPAAVAGLHGPSSEGAAAAALQTLGGLLGPAQMLVMPLTKKSAMASRGDLIVAVDDHRVRTQQEFEDRLSQMKPGDTTYITVLRPLPSGGHQTLKLAVHIGQWGQPVANVAPPAAAMPAPASESYPH
jgi:PDZ domain